MASNDDINSMAIKVSSERMTGTRWTRESTASGPSEMAKVIYRFIESLEAAQRLYPDLYAEDLATVIAEQTAREGAEAALADKTVAYHGEYVREFYAPLFRIATGGKYPLTEIELDTIARDAKTLLALFVKEQVKDSDAARALIAEYLARDLLANMAVISESGN